VKKLKSWLLGIFACHVLLVNPKLKKHDAGNTVKISAMITVSLPLLVTLVGFVAIFSQPSTLNTVKTVIVVSVLIIYFGVSSVTDRIYDQNVLEVRQRANEIKGNPKQGVFSARRRLVKIYLGHFVAMTAIVILVKLLRRMQ
jgi:hypothetical protein